MGLAILARAGLLAKSRVLAREQEELRDLSRPRQKYVDDMSGHKNRINKLLIKVGFNVSQVATDVFIKTGQTIIEGLMDEMSPEAILKKIELILGYRLKDPREDFLQALRGTMSPELKYLSHSRCSELIEGSLLLNHCASKNCLTAEKIAEIKQ
jgi:hypothetical protein